MGRGKWTAEQKAAASQRAKDRIAANGPPEPFVVAQPERGNGTPAVASYERPKQKSIPKGDGFHYTTCEKKPTTFDLDYQGDKLSRRGDELCPELGTKEFDVYRLPIGVYNEIKRANAKKSADGANAPVDFQPGGGTITRNTVDTSDLDTVKIEVVQGQAPPSSG